MMAATWVVAFGWTKDIEEIKLARFDTWLSMSVERGTSEYYSHLSTLVSETVDCTTH